KRRSGCACGSRLCKWSAPWSGLDATWRSSLRFWRGSRASLLPVQRLVSLRAELDTAGSPPSRQIARLRRLVDLLDAQRNQLFAPIAFLLLWSTQFAIAIENWRRISGPAVGRWLAAVGEFEALCALSGYGYEHPADPFPELVEQGIC